MAVQDDSLPPLGRLQTVLPQIGLPRKGALISTERMSVKRLLARDLPRPRYDREAESARAGLL